MPVRNARVRLGWEALQRLLAKPPRRRATACCSFLFNPVDESTVATHFAAPRINGTYIPGGQDLCRAAGGPDRPRDAAPDQPALRALRPSDPGAISAPHVYEPALLLLLLLLRHHHRHQRPRLPKERKQSRAVAVLAIGSTHPSDVFRRRCRWKGTAGYIAVRQAVSVTPRGGK